MRPVCRNLVQLGCATLVRLDGSGNVEPDCSGAFGEKGADLLDRPDDLIRLFAVAELRKINAPTERLAMIQFALTRIIAWLQLVLSDRVWATRLKDAGGE